MKRVRGHALTSEGTPRLRDTTCPECAGRPEGLTWGNDLAPTLARQSGRNDGHARCTCGVLSPHLESQGARQRWHRAHKAEVSES